MSSLLAVETPRCRSDWDETPITKQTTNTVSNVTTGVHTLKLQLFGIIGVLLVILVVVVPITFVVSSIKTSTTTCCVNSITTTITTTTTSKTTTKTTTSTTTADPYACSNMTVLHNWDFPGYDLTSLATSNYTAYCTLCLTTSGCVGFTFASSACYPKSSIGTGGQSSSTLISAKY